MINARPKAVHSLENLHSNCGSHVGGQNNANQSIFPYDIIENPVTSLARNSVFNSPNNFKFGTKTLYCLLSYYKIWGKLILISRSMFFMKSYANHHAKKLPNTSFCASFSPDDAVHVKGIS